jgi:hypothetical protein
MELAMIIRRGGPLCDKNENFIMDVSCVHFIVLASRNASGEAM